MKKIARTIDDLPVLKDGEARLVHLTNLEAAEKIAETGLNYCCSVDSTARCWSDESKVKYSSDDPRFRDTVAVILDVPFDELNLHYISRNPVPPGTVPAKYVVGIVGFTTFEIEKYKGKTVIVSDNEEPHVRRNEVACIARDAILIHLDAYRLIQESPKAKEYLDTILEHEVRKGTGHIHDAPPSEREQEVLDYLKEKGYFER